MGLELVCKEWGQSLEDPQDRGRCHWGCCLGGAVRGQRLQNKAFFWENWCLGMMTRNSCGPREGRWWRTGNSQWRGWVHYWWPLWSSAEKQWWTGLKGYWTLERVMGVPGNGQKWGEWWAKSHQPLAGGHWKGIHRVWRWQQGGETPPLLE